MDPHRRLLAHGVNEIIRAGQISLDYQGIDTEDRRYISTEIGGHPSLVQWRDNGSGEIFFTVWWKYSRAEHEKYLRGAWPPSTRLVKRRRLPEIFGATVCGWLMRGGRAFLEGKGRNGMHDLYMRRRDAWRLHSLPDPHPIAFDLEGLFA